MQALNCVLIANRGAIAVRCIRACRQLSITTVAVFTKADALSLHALLADHSVLLESEDPQAYTDIDAMMRICKDQNSQGIFPAYGFLSENTEFSRRVEDAGMVFIGPDSNAIESMGLKHTARDLAIEAGVPVIQGSELLNDPNEAVQASKGIYHDSYVQIGSYRLK